MKRNAHKARKMARGTNFRDKIARVMRRVLGSNWHESISIQRQSQTFIMRLRQVLDEKIVARLHDAMHSLATRYGASYDYGTRSLSVAA